MKIVCLQHFSLAVLFLCCWSKQLTAQTQTNNFWPDQLQWELLGPTSRPGILPKLIHSTYQIGRGRLRSVWANPINKKHLMVGSNSGGLWQTKDGGINWQCLTANVPAGGVWDMAVHGDTIFIATGTVVYGFSAVYNYKFWGHSNGVLRSVDGGQTWEILNLSVEPADRLMFRCIEMHPQNHNTVYTASDFAIYKTVDGGQTWKTMYQLAGTDITRFHYLEINPHKPNELYASGDNIALVSTNSGRSWHRVDKQLPAFSRTNRFIIKVDPRPGHYDSVYVFCADVESNKQQSIMVSANKGKNWKPLFDSNKNGRLYTTGYTINFAVSPLGDFWVSGIYQYISTNKGASFSKLTSNNIHVDFQQVIFPYPEDPDFVYAVNDGGAYSSAAAGLNWQNINGNLSTNEFFGLDISPQDTGLVVAGSQDCGTLLWKQDSGWTFIFPGDGGTSVIDRSNSQRMYISCNRSIKRTDDGGHSFADLGHMLSNADSPMMQHPTKPGGLFAGYTTRGWRIGLSVSYNAGRNWNLDYYPSENWGPNLTAMGMSAADTSVCFAAINYDDCKPFPWEFRCQLWKTADAGVSWQRTDSTIAHLLKHIRVTGILVHPNRPDSVWISLGHFYETQKVYLSTNGGVSWNNVSEGLPNIPCQCLAYDAVNQVCFVGTDYGLYSKRLHDDAWSYCTGFPKVMVQQIKINPTSGHLVVATFGSGIVRTKLPAYGQ